ncbi:MAG TPA: hypothetical protein VFD00_12180 [Thermoclostridium sp.]|nr:hypothetical protein [Thermoclostridium sp.]
MTIKEIELTPQLPQVFYPWRRFLARALELSLYSTLWSTTLIFAFHVNIASRSSIENGYLKGVSFVVELQNQKDLLGSYDNQIILISLSYACAQEEIGLFSNAPKRIIDNIIQNTFKDYNFTESGVEFTCQTEYSEYIDSYSGILIPKENAEQYYFKIEYTVDNVG